LHQPDELAIEAPFFAQNVQSLIKLGRAQGAAIAAALERDIPVFEYLPKKIKQAVTGNGNASKQQVAAMLATLLQTPTDHFKSDATDALGAAYCHFLRMNDPTTTAVNSTSTRTTKPKGTSSSKKKQAWEQFLRSNPDRQL
jgi:crossover junction endodeoxyribonuclease RuvC